MLINKVGIKLKNMNLENLNLVELNAQEVLNTDGGEIISGYRGGDLREPIHHVGDFFVGLLNGILGKD